MAPSTTTTYGKRSVKRKNNLDDAPSTNALVGDRADMDDDELLLQSTLPKKRRVESVKPPGENVKRTKLPPSHESTEEETTPEPVLTTKPRVTTTYGTPKKTRPPEVPPSGFLVPSAVATQEPVTPSRTTTNSPTKLAKRMLARSKTESALESQGSLFSFGGEKRTPSLPTLPSSRGPSLSPSRGNNTLLTIPGPDPTSSNTLLPLPAPPLLNTTTVSKTSSSISRTYAGNSRSYLSASSAITLNPDGTLVEDDIEDEYSRESYTSLRRRWGVDQSEDDPYDNPFDNNPAGASESGSQTPSPSKARGGRGSAVGTPNASPSKGKNKVGGGARAPPLPPGMMNPLKSITELRNKGESRRFLDEVAYLLDGMSKSQGVGLIRASALEIATKLCDSEFFRKAKAADVFSKVYDLFVEAGAGRGDKVLDTLFLFYVVLISKDASSLTEIASHIPEVPPSASNAKGKGKAPVAGPAQSLVDILFSILDSTCAGVTSDPLVLVAPSSDGTLSFSDAELKIAGLGKKEKTTMIAILSTIKKKSKVFRTSAKIKTPLLITHISQLLPPLSLSQHHLPSLLTSLHQSLQPLQAWMLTRPNTVDSKTADDDLDLDFESVFAHLRLLDLYLLGQWAPLEAAAAPQEDVASKALVAARKDRLAEGLVALGICAEVSLQRDYEGAVKCLECVLRVLVSLTHGDEAWSRSVVLENTETLRFLMRTIAKSGEEVGRGVGRVKKEEDVEEHEDPESQHDIGRRARALDRLCLSLALLTNLVQALDDVKDLVRETYLDPTTCSSSSCMDACTCPERNSASALEILVQLYVRQSAEVDKVEEDADASFLRGHLAVLFGLFMQGNAANQRRILDLLPRKTTTGLVDQARQFVGFFAAVVGEEQDEVVEFLQQVVDELNR